MKRLMTGVASGALLALLAGCSAPDTDPAASSAATAAPDTGAAAQTVADAAQFLSDAEDELRAFSEFGSRTAWVQNNFITYDTNWLLERMSTQGTEMSVRLATETARYNDLDLTTEMSRKMNVLRAGITLPAPSDSAAAARLSELTTRMGSAY